MLTNKIIYDLFAGCARLSAEDDKALRERVFEVIRRTSLWSPEFDKSTGSYRDRHAPGSGHWIRVHAAEFLSSCDWYQAAYDGPNLLCCKVFQRNLRTTDEAYSSYYRIAVPILRETILAQIDSWSDEALRTYATRAKTESPAELRIAVRKYLA